MSLPISQAAAILGAARVAQSVVGNIAERITDAVGFDQVLHDGVDLRSETDSDLAVKESLMDQTLAAIRDRLGKFGIAANPPIELAVQRNGALEVTGNHDRAAEIESILASDGELVELASRLYSAAGSMKLTVDRASSDLTRTGAQDTMNGPPGGYANW